MDQPRRNDTFDQELRRALAAGGGAPSDPHLDAEVAAAWMDRRLDAAAQRAVETHLAGCFDCQALLATLARISPDEATAASGLAWWRRLRTGWLVPATVAAAAALVIWVAVPQQRGGSQNAVTVQESAPAPSTPPEAVAPSARTDAATAKPELPEAERKALNKEQALVAAPQAAPTPSAPAAVAPVPPALERRERLADAAAPAVSQPTPAESDKALGKVEAEAPAVDAKRESITVTGETPAAPPAPARQDAAAGASRRAIDSLAARATLSGPNALVIIAADSAARWRRTGAVVEFAPRADGSFAAATLPVAVNAIVSGTSPGGTVCWLVGRGGIVLLTTDGLRFARVAAPASVDLVAVTATDARTATVVAADGRRFRTTDQGATWSVQ